MVLAQDHICAHLNERVRLNELADVVGINESYFTRVFRERTVFTPSEFRKRFFCEKETGGA